MEVFKAYLLQNWTLILILIAFVIMLMITVFLDKKTNLRLYILIAALFALSIIVFTEFYLSDIKQRVDVRIWLMAIRYSATPIIISMILYTLVRKAHFYVFVPAFILAVLNLISIWTGIVFSIDPNTGELIRGALGYLPYIGVGIYSAVLVYVLIIQSNKTLMDIIPIVFLAFSFASGIILPLVIGKDYSKIFVSTIGVALFVYYVFLILQLTKKDSLTSLYNRQAYYATIEHNSKDINAVVSIDMNGLKTINDNEGHIAGDNALISLSKCFLSASKKRQFIFRVGGDEFIILCKKTSEEELKELINQIKENVSRTTYSCSIGYCFSTEENKEIEEMVKFSDEMMYKDKAKYYKVTGKDRREK